MRNLDQYPVTPDEVVKYLENLKRECLKTKLIGDMRPILIDRAISAVSDEDHLREVIREREHSIKVLHKNADAMEHRINELEAAFGVKDDMPR